MNRQRKVLIISPHWPPINAPDMQRVRMSLEHYRENGWVPTVLTVDPDDVAGTREDELLSTFRADTPVFHSKVLPRKLCAKLGLGSLGLRAWASIKNAGSRLLKQERFDLVYFSTTQFIIFTLGPIWQRKHGVPFVIDIQDPWRTDYYEQPGAPKPPGGAKYLLARFLANTFEEPTYRQASGFVSVSERYLTDLGKKYAGLDQIPSEVIEFGGSLSDLRIAAGIPNGPNHPSKESGKIDIIYTGAAGPIMPDAVELLFESFAEFREVRLQEASRFRFHFIGTSYVEPGCGTPSILPLAFKHGISDHVFEIPHRIGHLESLSIQSGADVLFLGGSSDLAYSPSKIYPYYLSGRPILSLVFPGSVLESLLRRLNCPTLISIQTGKEREKSKQALCSYFDNLSKKDKPDPRVRDLSLESEILPEKLTLRQCALFDKAVSFYNSKAVQ